MVNLKVNTVIAIGHEMIFIQYQQSLVLQVGASRQWITKHIAISISITTGLKHGLTVQKAYTRGL